MKNVLISGATGLIGSKLVKQLQHKGYNVAILSRSVTSMDNVITYIWDVKKQILPQEAVDNADIIVHLAGANVGSQRWTADRKKEIIDSRVRSSQLLLEAIKKSPKKPEAFISASAVGYYGLKTDEKIFNEEDNAATDFFGQVGKAWEQVLEKTAAMGMRSVALRLGVVLDNKEGALAKMAIPLKFGFGTPIGSGKQYIPWVHIDDAVAIFSKAIEDNKMEGAFNVAAPEHVTNAQFMQTLCSIKKRLYIPVPVPGFLLKTFLGEMANIVLKGSRVSSQKIRNAGFTFQYTELKNALKALC